MTTSPAPAPHLYPVRVSADPDPHPSRFLWLVKWLLAIPHYVILAFLWLAVFVLTLVALVAILVSGRYPPSILEFTVGVLRWSWRVSYYGYSALGTDRYPPFTLADVPDYPARLEVDPPGELSRGLVLVKWWLLAIPHYLIVGALVGSGQWVTVQEGSAPQWVSTTGLLSLLVFFAAVIVAVTGRYPAALHDLVVGLNRWTFRVAGYALLMTDAYPPLRLDQGAADPSPPPPDASAPPPEPELGAR